MAELNQIARDHGIAERDLKFSVDQRASQLRIRELRVKNASLAVILKYICGNSIIRFKVSGGRVLLWPYGIALEEPVQAEEERADPANDPFAEPGQEVRTEKMPLDPDDPFSQEDSEEADPFAEPVPSIKSK